MRKDRLIHFTWDIHYKCNFRCPYCWFYKKWTELKKRNIYISPDGWMKPWGRIYDKYGSVGIEITGGEPFIYPDFIELVKLLSSIHRIKITTNLSGNIQKFVKEISPVKVRLDLNFHPMFANIDSFLQKALILKKAGFKFGVCYLAYPAQINLIDFFKQKFDGVDINFALAAFWGKYKDRKYPEDYTEEEKEMIKPYLGDINRIDYHLDLKSPKGKLCSAGFNYAVIQADGKVFRCSQYLDKPIGNIFDNKFSLLSKPLRCEAKVCPGNEYVNLEEVKDTNDDMNFNDFYKNDLLDSAKKYKANFELNEKEIENKAILLSSYPRKLFIMPTKRCNLNCIMCSRQDYNLESDISWNIIKKVIDIFPYVDFIEWQGGEVFLYKRFRELVQKATEYSYLKQVITTNGLLIDENWADLIVKNSVELRVSIDSVNKKTYEYIRKGGNFDRLTEKLNIINEKVEKYRKKDILANMLVVVMKANYNEVDNLVNFAKNNNFNNIVFNYMNLDTKEAKEENIFKLSNEKMLKKLQADFSKYKNDNFVVVMPSIKKELDKVLNKRENKYNSDHTLKNKRIFCSMPWINFYIEPDVSVGPHCFCFKKREHFSPESNISFLDMWNGKIMQEYRKKMLTGDYSWCNERDCLTREATDSFFKG